MQSARTRFNQFYKQSVEGGLAEKIKLPYGELASFNADASKMVFQIISREFRNWKRYRGGMASDLTVTNKKGLISGLSILRIKKSDR